MYSKSPRPYLENFFDLRNMFLNQENTIKFFLKWKSLLNYENVFSSIL